MWDAARCTHTHTNPSVWILAELSSSFRKQIWRKQKYHFPNRKGGEGRRDGRGGKLTSISQESAPPTSPNAAAPDSSCCETTDGRGRRRLPRSWPLRPLPTTPLPSRQGFPPPSPPAVRPPLPAPSSPPLSPPLRRLPPHRQLRRAQGRPPRRGRSRGARWSLATS